MSQRARVLLFTGDGKGKTSAALGMSLRAAGHDMRVLIIQFIKDNGVTGETRSIENLTNVKIIPTGLGFVPPATSEPGTGTHTRAHLRHIFTDAQAYAPARPCSRCPLAPPEPKPVHKVDAAC